MNERLTDILISAIIEENDGMEDGEHVKAILDIIEDNPKCMWEIIYRCIEKCKDDSMSDEDKELAGTGAVVLTFLMFERFDIDVDTIFSPDHVGVVDGMTEDEIYEAFHRILSK